LDAHRIAYCADLQARGSVQIDLAERASYIVWRLARYKADLVRSPHPPAGLCDTAAPGAMFVFAERAGLDSDPATRTQRQIALGDAAYTFEQLSTWADLPANSILPTRCQKSTRIAGALSGFDR